MSTLDSVCASLTGKQLKHGLPPFQQRISASSGSIPLASEHAVCEREEKEFPFSHNISTNVLEAQNYLWTQVNECEDSLFYSSEDDIVHYVRTYLENVLKAMKSPLAISAEIAVKQIRPDLCVLLHGYRLVGVVEVKKPGSRGESSILLQPTVLGELFDQMLLVEGFYGMGPVCGILTTGEEWFVAWFPVDHEHLKDTPPVGTSDSFSTPEKNSSSKEENSPTGATPSQTSPRPHLIIYDRSADDDDNNEADDTTDISEVQPRFLFTTRVFQQSNEGGEGILRLLCSAFDVMANAHLHHRPGVSQCLFKFHRDKSIVTWHPASHDVVYANVSFDRFPRSNTSVLIALEDLGRGSTGKAWLCVTLTQPHSAACVLKFSNRQQGSNLELECKNWERIYPEFTAMIKVQEWSGSRALMMPHFAPIATADRVCFKIAIRALLLEKFENVGLVHPDVRWRNIGQYKNNSENVVIPVLFDLHGVHECNSDGDIGWVDSAMSSLYPMSDEFTE